MWIIKRNREIKLLVALFLSRRYIAYNPTTTTKTRIPMEMVNERGEKNELRMKRWIEIEARGK